jgi:hypothetical protein
MLVGIPFPQDSPIIDIFNEVMDEFRANGMVEKLTKKYISIVEKKCTSPTVYYENYRHKCILFIAYLFN